MIKYVVSLIIIAMCALNTFNYLDAHEIISQETENQEIKMIQNSTPEYLYKIISQEQWQKSLLENKVIGSSIDEEFIHLAKEDQVDHVVKKFWNNMDYIVLRLASKKLVGRLIYEKNPGGSTEYYHLYEGNIPLDAVVEVTVVRVTNK